MYLYNGYIILDLCNENCDLMNLCILNEHKIGEKRFGKIEPACLENKEDYILIQTFYLRSANI